MAEKRLREYTKRELSEMIHKKVDVLNRRMQQYFDDGNANSIVKNELNRVIQYSGKGRGTGNFIGYGIRGKRKAEMIRQIRELDYFESWDIFTEEGQKMLEDRENQSYETFSRTHEGYTKDEWKNLVELFGSMDKGMLEQLGSDDVIQLNLENETNKNQVNLLKVATDVYRDSNFKGSTPEDVMDEIRRRMDLAQL